jgi:V/A-type H+-transporting ATPase subunit D
VAISFQYNKTYLQQLSKELKVRENALPTLQAKESALRVEVKKAREEVKAIEEELKKEHNTLSPMNRLWCEFPQDKLAIKTVDISFKKIAGVKTPILNKAEFDEEAYSYFSMPAWVPQGMEILKKIVSLGIQKDLALKKVEILEYARKKTTQKVNLYEKVQIPGYQEAIRRIKRFLEDEENLAKSAQKILKARIEAAEAAK